MAVLAVFLLSVPVRAGVPLAGMGGVGTGVASSTGDIADNPAASSVNLRRHEGAFSAGASYLRLVFSGNALNPSERTTSAFYSANPLSWSMVTPVLGSGRGRLGAGSWQLDRRELQLKEKLDLSMASSPGGQPLSTDFFSGLSRMKQDESLYAHGISWIQPVFGGDHIISLGGALITQSSQETLLVTAEPLTVEGVDVNLREVQRRREMYGAGLTLGWHFRPVPGGSIGAGLLYAGKMSGKIWEVSDGGPLLADGITRSPQIRFSAGGSFSLFDAMTAALDLRYCSGVKTEETLFGGTPSAWKYAENSDAVFSMAVGGEYRIRIDEYQVPLRIGFFTKPDAVPARSAGTVPVSSVKELDAPPFRQDLMGVTAGVGFESGQVRADLAAAWLVVNSPVSSAGATGEVESGDARNSLGIYLSISSKFGGMPE